MTELTVARLRELVTYDPETGIFLWATCRRGCKPGSRAGSRNGRYVYIGLDGAQHLAHRLAWLYMTGGWPKSGVDHDDRDGQNNKWTNLKEATQLENMQNRGVTKRSASGHVGVHWDKKRNVWAAHICFRRKRYFLGAHKRIEDAIAAYADGKRKLHQFHPEVV
jgi:hypothetical protein